MFTYKNGNSYVTIFEDGSKVRETEDDTFKPRFPESIDMAITNYCDVGCPFCYANCSTFGKDANLSRYHKLFDSIHPYTELALQVNAFTTEGLYDFLVRMKERYIFCNITVNKYHFEKFYDYIKELTYENLIHGIGLSTVDVTENLIYKAQKFDNLVFHVINGIFTRDQYDSLKDNDLKLLILGYKELGRGIDYEESYDTILNKTFLKNHIEEIMYSGDFKVVSFDNLALEQLSIKDKMKKEDFEKFYMGDDGMFSMYIDLVGEYFSKSSIDKKRYDLKEDYTVDDCYKILRTDI